MKRRPAHRNSACLSTALLVALLSLWGCGPGGDKAPGGEAQEPACAEGRACEAEEERSDLDRTVAELKAEVCEHDVPTYTCDVCRFEVGVAKAPPELFDAPQGGSLRRHTVGLRAVGGGRDLNGEVRLNEERSVYLGPVVPGVVRSIRADLGAKVAKGQVLYEVDSPEFREAKSGYARAASSLDLARASEQRESELFAKGICPRRDLEEARSTLRAAEAECRAAASALLSMGLSERDLAALSSGADPSGLMPVRAPFAGVVLERSLGLGALVQPGDRALLLADTSEVWVQTTLYEGELASLAGASPEAPVGAEVTVASFPGRTFTGSVERVGGTLDEATRATSARVVVKNSEGLLRAGMFARVRLLTGAGEGLALPEAAVLEDEGRAFVFVHLEGPYYIRRPVEVGRTSSGWVEVLGGVQAGDTVVSEGAFLLKSDVLRSKMGAGCAD